jgi:transcriptional regulator GlxA family with amidase domain
MAFGAQAAARKPYTRNVAVVVYKNAELLDFAGPAEVFSDAAGSAAANGEDAFHVYLVAKTTEPLIVQGFMKVTPDYSIANAPKPDILVIPGGNSQNVSNDPEFMAWTKKAAEESEVTLSVCTGALVLAKAGLLDDLNVTTWFGAIDMLAKNYPKVHVTNGRRFVDNGHYVTTAGVSAGIDGSLHVIARLLGRRNAEGVARYMEYHWTPEAYLATAYSYLNPSTDEAGRQMQLAAVYGEAKQNDEAMKVYRSLVAANPANNDAWSELAELLASSNDHRGAADAYLKTATDTSQRSAFARYAAALQYAKAGDDDRAIELLHRAWNEGLKEHRDHIMADPIVARLMKDSRMTDIASAK